MLGSGHVPNVIASTFSLGKHEPKLKLIRPTESKSIILTGRLRIFRMFRKAVCNPVVPHRLYTPPQPVGIPGDAERAGCRQAQAQLRFMETRLTGNTSETLQTSQI